MRAEYRDEKVLLTLDREEVGRLSALLAESAAGLSRAEFFIRVGCSLPNIEALAKGLESFSKGRLTDLELAIVAGVEREENPPRLRSTAETD